jgi:hypothetical protein
MTILKNFDIDALRKSRARASSKPVDLVAGINEINPDIARLKVGETARLDIPKDIKLRQFVMAVTAKLNNLTPKGAPWEGRTFKTASDPDAGYLYVQRGENVTPVVRKRGTGGGRRKAAPASGSAPARETETVRA